MPCASSAAVGPAPTMSTRCSGQRMGVRRRATVRHPTSRAICTAQAMMMTARENEKKSVPAKNAVAAVMMIPADTARNEARPTVQALCVRSGEYSPLT
jgi:hypothetical protein